MKIHVLIVDDEPQVRQLIRAILRAMPGVQFEFTEAEDGQDALRRFDPKRTDLVLLDWRMPRLSGPGFIYRIQGLAGCRKVPVIMVTGESSFGRIQEALDRLGADGYVVKPFTPDELQRVVARQIERIEEARPPEQQPASGLLGRLLGAA